MLSMSDNDLMCRVGPGTPMGNFLREYWIPALCPEDVRPDGPPQRMRLLGENLIAFRTTSGDIGLIQNACPHRGASMFFGRNEEDGLRCVYHGWKFDTTGACVDMPSEPAESNFKNKVRTRAYPCLTRNGIVWAYMGPRDVPPPLPDLPPNLDPNCRALRRLQECNYMQALEGDIDTVHAGFLHLGHLIADRDYTAGSAEYYGLKQRNARFELLEHEIGATYAAVRPAEVDTDYWRSGHFLLPFYTMNAPGVMPLKNSVNAWVPLDDQNTMVWAISPQGLGAFAPDAAGIGGLKVGVRLTAEPQGANDPYPRRQPGQPTLQQRRQFLLETSEWIGRFRPLANKTNDYFIDRNLQSAMRDNDGDAPRGNYSGLPGAAQDPMAQESMGPIYDRTQEHLGTSDSMIIRARRRLVDGAKALRDLGTVPTGVDKPELYRMRSGGALLPKDVDGLEVLKPVHSMRKDNVVLPVEVRISHS